MSKSLRAVAASWDAINGIIVAFGLDKVRAEFSLTALAYNLRRTLNIIGVNSMIAAGCGLSEAATASRGVRLQTAQVGLTPNQQVGCRGDSRNIFFRFPDFFRKRLYYIDCGSNPILSAGRFSVADSVKRATMLDLTILLARERGRPDRISAPSALVARFNQFERI